MEIVLLRKGTIMDSSSTAALVVRNGSGKGGGERMKKELSEDNILDILTKLPVKSLMRFKCVSKNWYSLILSPTLVAMHFTHTSYKNTVSLFQRWHCNTGTSTSTTLRFDFGYVPKKLKLAGSWDYIHIVGCSNGVVCLSLSRPTPQNKYALWNPATRQVRLIEDGPEETGKKTHYNAGFCFDSSTNSFKVALFKWTSQERGKQFQVNVFSTVTSTWTEKSQGLPYQLLSIGKCTSVNGSVHQYAEFYDHGREFNACILSYNMIDELFKATPLPFPGCLTIYTLTDYKGSLALFVRSRRCNESWNKWILNAPWEVWVLNACGGGGGGGATQSWSKLLTFSPSPNIRYAVGFFTYDNVDLVLVTEMKCTCSLYLYDPMNGETKKLWKTFPVLDTFPYHESLMSLH